ELTNFPVTLAAYAGEELSFKIEFDRRRLDDAAIRRQLGHLRHLLEGLAVNPQALAGDLALVTDVEYQQLTREFNTPSGMPSSRALRLDGGSTLHRLFEAQATRRPEAVALTCEGRSLTYAELNSQSNRLARQLVQLGVKPDTLVGLCLDRSIELVIAILAI